MRDLTFNDGYVEDSEGEGDIMVDAPRVRNVAGGLPPPPRLPPPLRAMDTTVSTIQTPNFTSLPPALNHPPETPINVHNTTVSTIQSANFTTDRFAVSDISSFSPIGAANSSIQPAQAASTASGSSFSTSTSAPVSAAPRGKPRPRAVFKKNPTAAAPVPDASTSSLAPSSFPVSSANVSFPSFYAMPPPLPPMLLSSAPSHTATTVLTTQRISDSGVEIMDLEKMDIAERAKLRSRGRSQAKGKQINYDDVIELSSSDDELSLPKSKSKPKPKPKAKKPAAPKEPSSDKGKAKGKSRDPSKPSPSKRAKTTHILDGVESDVDTIPMATSDFPIPAQQPPLLPLPPHIRQLSSQLPPSDPPPPPSTSGSSAPRTSQDAQPNINADRFRDESPLSSPPPPMPRKRKRPSPPSRIPGLDDEDNSYMGADEDSTLAGPVSSGMVPVVEITKVPKKSRSKESDPPPPPPSPGIVPETQLVDPLAMDKEKPAPQKKRKRGAEDGEDWDAGLDEELLAQAAKSKSKKRSRANEEDEEEYGASSSKAKAKVKKDKTAKKALKEKAPPKEKGMKGKAGAKGKASSSSSRGVVEGSDGEEMSISIGEDKVRDAMPPPPTLDPVSKRKGKGRPSSSKGASDEVSADASAPKRGKGEQRALVLSDDEDDGSHTVSTNVNSANASLDIDSPPHAPSKKGGRKSTGGDQGSKENEAPSPPSASPPAANSSSHSATASTPVRPVNVTPQPARTSFAQSNRAYTISSKKTKSTPMSELIRRVSSLPGSPFPVSSRPTYSSLAKASKSALRRIAPLHPNRRTPPPPPPRPPPPKKSKKMLELEEKWEMELEDSIDGWYAMSEEERATLRRAKRDHELGFDD